MPEHPDNVIAIMCRDERGAWQRVSSVKTKKGDNALLLPTDKGFVLVLGEVDEEDELTILKLIEDL